MKRLLIVLVLASLLIGLVPLGASLAENYANVYSGNKYGVRLREGPGTGYNSQLTVPNGTSLVVVESGTLWTKVQAGTTIGYMMSKFLVSGGTSSGVQVVGTATVTSGNGLRVWLRTAANGKRIGLYSVGTPVSILEKGDKWSRVMIGSSIGYMMTEFLKLPEPVVTPAPVFVPLTAVKLNYQYPLVGDVLKPVTTPADATFSCVWELWENGKRQSTLSSSSSYTVGSDDFGKQIKLTVTGTGAYLGSSFSVTSDPVVNSKAVTGVTLSNASPVQGDVLSAIVAPSSATVTYSWRVGGAAKGTDATYTVTAADVGKKIQVYVTALSPFTGNATSLASAEVTSATKITAVKLSTQYPIVGSTLTATLTPAAAAASYQWFVDGVQVGTSASYVVTAFDIGKKIQVKVTGTGDYSGSATSDKSASVASSLVTAVTLTNTSNVAVSTAPAKGETLRAKVTPSNATVTYQWYRGNNAISGANAYQYTVDPSDIGQTLHVVVAGTGSFGGVAASGRTGAATYQVTLTKATLSIATPTVGDKITATLTPTTAVHDGNTYIWYADNTVLNVTDVNFYTLSGSDLVGKRIRVQVMGNDTNTGTVVSDFTNPTVASTKLAGVAIYNKTTGGNAVSANPLVGHTLQANPNPSSAEDQVTYDWYANSTLVASGTDKRTITVDAAWKGQQLKVIVKGVAGSGYTTPKDGVSATTAVIPKTAGLTIPLGDRITPIVGHSPITSISGTVKVGATDLSYSAVVSWTSGPDHVRADLDQYGHFKPGVEYRAWMAFTLPSGYNVNESTITCGNTSTTPYKTTVYATFPVSGTQTVDDFAIDGLAIPLIGATPDKDIDASAQYTASAVTWTDTAGNLATVFEAGKDYKASFTLTAKMNYEFDPAWAVAPFTVAGASSVKFVGAPTAATAVTIEATFRTISTNTKAQIILSRSSVPSGATSAYASDRIVECTAQLQGYAGDTTTLPWTWKVGNRNFNTTRFADPADGTLIIAKDEPVGTVLDITASVTLSGKTYTATTKLSIVAATETTDEIQVEFLSKQTTLNHDGKTALTSRFVAVAINSDNELVNWTLRDGMATSSGTHISADGVLTIAGNETATELTIIAKAQAKLTQYAEKTVKIVYKSTAEDKTVSLKFTKSVTSMAPGEKYTFEVTALNTTNEIKFYANGDSVELAPGVQSGGVRTCTVTVKTGAAVDAEVSIQAVVDVDGFAYTAAPVKVFIKSAEDEKKAAVEAALKVWNEAKAVLDKATADDTAAQAALNDAQNELTAAQTALNTAQSDMGTASTALSDAQAAKNTADGDVAAAQRLVTAMENALITAEGNYKAAMNLYKAESAEDPTSAETERALNSLGPVTVAMDNAQSDLTAAQNDLNTKKAAADSANAVLEAKTKANMDAAANLTDKNSLYGQAQANVTTAKNTAATTAAAKTAAAAAEAEAKKAYDDAAK